MSIVDFCKCFWKNRIFVSFFSEYQTWNLIKRGTQMSSKCLIVNFNTYSNNTLVLPVLCFVALISIANAAETTWSTEHHDLSYRLSGFYGHTIIRGGGPWMMVWCGLCWVTGDFWSLSLRGPEQQGLLLRDPDLQGATQWRQSASDEGDDCLSSCLYKRMRSICCDYFPFDPVAQGRGSVVKCIQVKCKQSVWSVWSVWIV
jgi:hypothetical protein